MCGRERGRERGEYHSGEGATGSKAGRKRAKGSNGRGKGLRVQIKGAVRSEGKRIANFGLKEKGEKELQV